MQLYCQALLQHKNTMQTFKLRLLDDKLKAAKDIDQLVELFGDFIKPTFAEYEKLFCQHTPSVAAHVDELLKSDSFYTDMLAPANTRLL